MPASRIIIAALGIAVLLALVWVFSVRGPEVEAAGAAGTAPAATGAP